MGGWGFDNNIDNEKSPTAKLASQWFDWVNTFLMG